MRTQTFRHVKYGIALLLLLAPGTMWPQQIDEYQVKAAYLYNFAKFVDWPPSRFQTADAPLRLCVWKDSAFQSTLEQIVRGRKIGTHPVQALTVDNGERAAACHILFIEAAQRGRTPKLLALLGAASVMTVGESSDFLDSGGSINFVVKDERVQFEVNSRAASEAGLQISSRMLSLARNVLR